MAIRSKIRQHGRTTEVLFAELELKLTSTVGKNKKGLKILIAKSRQEIALVCYSRAVTSQTGVIIDKRFVLIRKVLGFV